jgi:hypothetical protein
LLLHIGSHQPTKINPFASTQKREPSLGKASESIASELVDIKKWKKQRGDGSAAASVKRPSELRIDHNFFSRNFVTPSATATLLFSPTKC